MHSAKRLVNMSTHARRHQSASARVGMFASRCPFSQLSKNQVLLHLERSDWFCIIPCGRRCRACGTFPSSYRSSAHLPATMASSDSSLRFRAPACAPFGFGLRRRFPSSSALRCIPARPPKFLTELSRRVVLITSRFVCDSCSFHHDSSAKLVLAHLHHSYPTIRVLGPRSSRLRRSCWS